MTPSRPASKTLPNTRERRRAAQTTPITSGTAEEFHVFLQQAAALGANVVRTTLSPILCGDRRKWFHTNEEGMAIQGRSFNIPIVSNGILHGQRATDVTINDNGYVTTRSL